MDVVVNASFSGSICLAGRIFYLKIFHEGFVIRPAPGWRSPFPSRAPRLKAAFRLLRGKLRLCPLAPGGLSRINLSGYPSVMSLLKCRSNRRMLLPNPWEECHAADPVQSDVGGAGEGHGGSVNRCVKRVQ